MAFVVVISELLAPMSGHRVNLEPTCIIVSAFAPLACWTAALVSDT